MTELDEKMHKDYDAFWTRAGGKLLPDPIKVNENEALFDYEMPQFRKKPLTPKEASDLHEHVAEGRGHTKMEFEGYTNMMVDKLGLDEKLRFSERTLVEIAYSIESGNGDLDILKHRLSNFRLPKRPSTQRLYDYIQELIRVRETPDNLPKDEVGKTAEFRRDDFLIHKFSKNDFLATRPFETTT
jgi:hypothetical protein